MKQIIVFLMVYFSPIILFAQGNCLVFPEASPERKACEYSYKAIEFHQGSRESQRYFDSAISIGPKYAWSYMEKSVPYFKRGLPHKGIQWLNKAVELEPQNYLCYRASWFFEYQSYQNCIADLERYYALPNPSIQFTPSGEMNMKIVLGLSYAKLGNYKRAAEMISAGIRENQRENLIGLFDFHALAVVQFLQGNHDDAILSCKRQLLQNGLLPDTYYYLGLALKKTGRMMEASDSFAKALNLIDQEGLKQNLCFQVNKSDIAKALMD
jgi:tetratricopeptide (TPR) repeat protein